MKEPYVVMNIIMTAVRTSGGLDAGWNERERRFDVIIPASTVKSIDFNKVRNELLNSSIDALEEQDAHG